VHCFPKNRLLKNEDYMPSVLAARFESASNLTVLRLKSQQKTVSTVCNTDNLIYSFLNLPRLHTLFHMQGAYSWQSPEAKSDHSFEYLGKPSS
jgi:hypothetical protein